MLRYLPRVVFIVAGVFAIARLLLQIVVFAGLLPIAEARGLPLDFAVYVAAGQHALAMQPLYPDTTQTLPTLLPYLYSPTFAVLMALLLRMFALPVLVMSAAIGHLAAYLWLYWICRRLFLRVGAQDAAAWLALLLPLWLVSGPFWSDLAYLNVRVFLALLQIGLIEAILFERLPTAALATLGILLIAPQWAILLLLPIVLRRYWFFTRLVGLVTLGYLAVAGVTITLLGPSYAIAQYRDYLRMLLRLSAIFPWRSVYDGIFGPNHALRQQMIYLVGNQPLAVWLTRASQIGLVLPLISYAAISRPAAEDHRRGLEWGLGLLLAMWAIIDLVWSDSFFLIVVLLAYFAPRLTHMPWPISVWTWAICTIYALLDLFRIVGMIVFGAQAMISFPSFTLIRSDLGTYLPTALLVILTLYGILLWSLWPLPHRVASPQRDSPS